MRQWLAVLSAVCGVSLAGTGGCMNPGAGPGAKVLISTAGGMTYSNHVKVVKDPAGGSGTVFQGDRVAKDSFQMTFTHNQGFFAVPAEYRGAVTLRVLVKGEAQVRAALVASGKMKSFYQRPPVTNDWCELVLPLAQTQGKLSPGDKVDDITIWLLSLEKGAALAADARIYLDRVVLDASAVPGTHAAPAR